jgi:tetratricopeptide (TPR) repeat protein
VTLADSMSRRLKKMAFSMDPIGLRTAASAAAPPAGLPAKERGRWEIAGICAALVILVFVVFGQTAGFGFVNYDDDSNVYATPQVTGGFSLHGIAWAFTHSAVGHWDPLTTLSHILDCQLYGLWPGGHHLTNVFLHGAAAVLLFVLLLEMTGALWRSAFVAAVWAIHPLRVESVAWVTERKDVLSGVFFLLTLLAYLAYTRKPGSKLRYCGVGAPFILGLMSKSMLMTLPFVLLLLDYWPLKRWNPGHGEAAWHRAWSLFVEKIPFFLISITFGFIAVEAGRDQMVSLAKAPLSQRAADALVTYLVYIKQLVWPMDLAVLYTRPAGGFPVALLLLAVAALGTVSAAVLLCRRKHPWLLVGWLWYLGMLVPVIGFFQSEKFPQDDRYTYLPQIGLCFAGTWMAADWAGPRRDRRTILAVVASLILCALPVIAYNQTTYWRDSATLWIHTLASTQDNFVAHLNYGNVLLQQHRPQDAIAEYHEALHSNPNYADAYSDLGNVLVQQGRTQEAIAECLAALRIDPDFPPAHNNLGVGLFHAGRTGEAVAEFHEALRLNPAYAEASVNLGNALLGEGRTGEAVAEFREALRIDPGRADARNGLGLALFQQGHAQEAIAEYREALRINPADVGAQYNLGNVLLQQGDAGEAIAHLQQACDLQPGNPAIQNTLAWILATAAEAPLRDGPRAVQLAMQACQSGSGGDPVPLRTLAAAYAQSGQFDSAVETAQKALQLARAQSTTALIAALPREIRLYQARRSFEAGR